MLNEEQLKTVARDKFIVNHFRAFGYADMNTFKNTDAFETIDKVISLLYPLLYKDNLKAAGDILTIISTHTIDNPDLETSPVIQDIMKYCQSLVPKKAIENEDTQE